MARETLEALKQSPSLTAFIASRQRITLGAMLETVQHLIVLLKTKVCIQGNPGTHGTSLSTGDPRESHLKRDLCVRMHTQYDSIKFVGVCVSLYKMDSASSY